MVTGSACSTDKVGRGFGEVTFVNGKAHPVHWPQYVPCIQMPTEMGGGAGKVAFIDTEGTFRPERIRPIAQRFNLDVDAVLENVRDASGGQRLALCRDELHLSCKLISNCSCLKPIPLDVCRSCTRGRTLMSSRWVRLANLIHACLP